jgi:hypothetical protein
MKKVAKEIVIHPHTFQKFMKYGKDSANLVSLYSFYIYHAGLQETNQPLATNDFVKRGLNWSLDKVKRVKKILKELKLIEVIQKGKYYYIHLPFIYTKKKVEKVVEKYKNTFCSKKEKKEEEPKEQKEKPNPFLEYLINSKISKKRANQIRNRILSIEDIDKYQTKFHSLYLAKWIVYCERMGIKYNRANLASWIRRMSALFSIEQYHMVENSIKYSLRDMKFPVSLKYSQYRGRSIKFDDGKVYKNLKNVFFIEETREKVYKFEGDFYIHSHMDIGEFFREYDYFDFFDRRFVTKNS